jgi:hypothetical protein
MPIGMAPPILEEYFLFLQCSPTSSLLCNLTIQAYPCNPLILIFSEYLLILLPMPDALMVTLVE